MTGESFGGDLVRSERYLPSRPVYSSLASEDADVDTGSSPPRSAMSITASGVGPCQDRGGGHGIVGVAGRR